MPFLVTDGCINCKYKDCVEVCPVDCFFEGGNMVVIHPDECIDCAVCEPECPVDAIKPDTISGADFCIELNRKYAEIWPNITEQGEACADCEIWADKPEKLQLLSEAPAAESGAL